jgi:hypothetical protein
MPIGYRLDHERGITLVVWDGTVGLNEVLAHVEHLRADPDYPAGNLHLTDLRTFVPAGPPPIDELGPAVLSAYARPGFRWAVVAVEAFAGVKELMDAVVPAGLDMIAFTDLHTACVWLGVDPAWARQTLVEVRDELRAPTG